MSPLQKSHYSWKIFLFRRSILVWLQLVHRRLQNFTILDQGNHKLEQIQICISMTTRKIIYANTDLHHQVSISVFEAQISPLQNILRGSWSCKLLHLFKGGGDSRRQLKFSLCETRRDSCICRLRRTRLTHQNNSSRDCSLFLSVM